MKVAVRARDLPRHFRRLVAFSTRPLTLSQVFSSGSSAIALIVAASLLAPRQFATFTLLSLVSNTLIGFGRAGVFSPAMIRQRQFANSFVEGHDVPDVVRPLCGEHGCLELVGRRPQRGRSWYFWPSQP